MLIRTLSELLLDVRAQLTGERVTVGALLDAFHERGFGFFLFLFALPAAVPLPGLGINLVIAVPLLALTLQQMLGREKVWLPARVVARELDTAFVDKIINAALPWTHRLERLVRPRLGVITQGVSSLVIGMLGFVMACSVLLPVPLTNTVPSMGIALMAIGVLMRDGLAVIAGALLGVGWIAMLVGVVVVFGVEGIEVLKQTIKSLI